MKSPDTAKGTTASPVPSVRKLGVPAVSVNTAEALARELGKALSQPGPHLIEMALV
jgi:thiamine pyrophosphate-dependent acetolactate synthase large subunit-like protein